MAQHPAPDRDRAALVAGLALAGYDKHQPLALRMGAQDEPHKRWMRLIHRHAVQVQPCFGNHFTPLQLAIGLLIHLDRLPGDPLRNIGRDIVLRLGTCFFLANLEFLQQRPCRLLCCRLCQQAVILPALRIQTLCGLGDPPPKLDLFGLEPPAHYCNGSVSMAKARWMGKRTTMRPGSRSFPAARPAASPVPKKISARWVPLIADPVSCAIISRCMGFAPAFSIQTGAPSGTNAGSTATVRPVVTERFIAPKGPRSAGT